MYIKDLNILIISAGNDNATNQIIFDCPKCGIPYKIVIYANLNGPIIEGVWKWSATKSDYSDFTIEPSIHNHWHGDHNYKNNLMPCEWHGTILNGKILQ